MGSKLLEMYGKWLVKQDRNLTDATFQVGDLAKHSKHEAMLAESLYSKALLRHFPPYKTLDSSERKLFETQLTSFMKEKEFFFQSDFTHDRTLAKFLISAAAVRIVFKTSDSLLESVSKIVVYSSAFIHRENGEQSAAGITVDNQSPRENLLGHSRWLETYTTVMAKNLFAFKFPCTTPSGFSDSFAQLIRTWDLSHKAMASWLKNTDGVVAWDLFSNEEVISKCEQLMESMRKQSSFVEQYRGFFEPLSEPAKLPQNDSVEAVYALTILEMGEQCLRADTRWQTLTAALLSNGTDRALEVHIPYLSLLHSLFLPLKSQDIIAHEFSHCIDFKIKISEGAEPSPEYQEFFNLWDDGQHAYFNKGQSNTASQVERAELFADACGLFFSRPSTLKSEKPLIFEALTKLFKFVPAEQSNCQWRLYRILLFNPSS